MLDGTHYFECGCGADEHTLRFTLDLDDEDEPGGKAIHTSIFLNNHYHWYKRLWIATKYLFGYKCKYGHWDSWILYEPDAHRLKLMLEEFINAPRKKTSDYKLSKEWDTPKPPPPRPVNGLESQTS